MVLHERNPQAFDNPGPFPPALAGHPILFMLTIMALFIGVLLALQWFYRIVSELCDDGLSWRHPLNVERMVKLMFVSAALTAATPRLVLVMTWQSLNPYWREVLSLGSWSVYIIWAPIFATAWWIDLVATPSIRFQLTRVPVPVAEVQYPGGTKKNSALAILILITLVAFATTYVRARPDRAAGAPHHANP